MIEKRGRRLWSSWMSAVGLYCAAEGQSTHDGKKDARRRVHRQRVHHPLSHPLVGRRARRRRARHLEPDSRARGRGRGTGARRCASARPAPSPRSPRWWRTRRSIASGSAGPTTRASRTWRRLSTRGRAAPNWSAIACEKPLGAQRRRSAAHGGARREGRRAPRLSREPALCARRRARKNDCLGARRGIVGAALPGARGRGARRAAHAVVLARRPAGRRRAERHDVPQPRGRTLPADQAGRAARTASGRPRSPRRSPRSSGRVPNTSSC